MGARQKKRNETCSTITGVRKSACVAGIVVWVFGLGLCAGAEAKTSEHLRVAASIAPIADMIRHVGGDAVLVTTVVPAGANPHTFELNPSVLQELEGSRIFFVVGYHLDHWLGRLAEGLPNAESVVSGTSDLLVVDGGIDPHYWLSVERAKGIARNVANTLQRVDPGRSEQYERNLENYLELLEQTDREIKSLLSELPTRNIVTAHDGWRYFAASYGLQVIGTVYPANDTEPTPKYLAGLAGVIKANRIQVLFSDVQMPQAITRSFADDLGLEHWELDPFGGVEGRRTYHDLMMYNARTIREALQNKTAAFQETGKGDAP